MAEPLFIVDGDNVAHVHGGREEYERVRAELVTAVVDHASRSGIDTMLVFDGAGPERTIGRTSIRHAGGETADTVIERLAHRHHNERDVTVVSSDTVLRHVAQREGVHAMSAREYVDRLGSPGGSDSPGPKPRQRFQLADTLDPAVREALERLRRGDRGA
ncbi:MAG: YacP-like domain [Gaiellales bacterium]|nr:YacP-like domain [Gaiellales bacterium]